MDVQCSACHKTIPIPDEKIPQASSFSFTCPYCRERIRVEGSVDSVTLRSLASEPESKNLDETLPSLEDVASVEVEPDPVPPGTRVAFVFVADDSWRKAAEDFFRSKGYYLVLPESAQEARVKLSLQPHDVILIQDDGDSGSLWEVIHSWRGLDRRERNVISLLRDVVSMAPEEAFRRGVNACLCLSDQGAKDELLACCLGEHEQMLLPWKQAREKEKLDL